VKRDDESDEEKLRRRRPPTAIRAVNILTRRRQAGGFQLQIRQQHRRDPPMTYAPARRSPRSRGGEGPRRDRGVPNNQSAATRHSLAAADGAIDFSPSGPHPGDPGAVASINGIASPSRIRPGRGGEWTARSATMSRRHSQAWLLRLRHQTGGTAPARLTSVDHPIATPDDFKASRSACRQSMGTSVQGSAPRPPASIQRGRLGAADQMSRAREIPVSADPDRATLTRSRILLASPTTCGKASTS